jgi:hypothetical protein
MKRTRYSRLLYIFAPLLCATLIGSGLFAQQGEPKKADEKVKTVRPTAEKYSKSEVSKDTFHGRSALSLPTATTAGDWQGSWVYVNRDVHLALWLDEKDGELSVKLRYLGAYLTPETFETDWSGTTNYMVQNKPAEFKFLITDWDAAKIDADWSWFLDLKGSSRTETAKIKMYRTGDGRRLVMHFTEYKRVIERAGQDIVYDYQQAWTFTKVSKRHARWDELPI